MNHTPRRRSTRRLALALLTLSLAPLSAGAGPFLPGEILLNELGGSSIQRYSATGTLLQTYTGTGAQWAGASLTPDGNLVTTYRSANGGVDLFNPAGAQFATFNVGAGNMNDVSVFANGTLALNILGTSTVRLYSQAGALLGTTTMTGVSNPVGSTVGTDNILYVADDLGNKVARVDQTGVFLGTFSLSFSPGDLVMSPLDGTLWVTGQIDDNIYHLTTSGTVLGSFATGLTGTILGIGLAPDGNSLYATSYGGGNIVRHLSLAGAQLGDFTITSSSIPAFMTVVPSPAPEPGSAVLLALGGGAVLGWRRRRASA